MGGCLSIVSCVRYRQDRLSDGGDLHGNTFSHYSLNSSTVSYAHQICDEDLYHGSRQADEYDRYVEQKKIYSMQFYVYRSRYWSQSVKRTYFSAPNTE